MTNSIRCDIIALDKRVLSESTTIYLPKGKRKMKELKLEELTTRQKLGMTMNAYVSREGDNTDYIVALIKDHSLGSVWINPTVSDFEYKMSKIKAAADYPILIMCDAENGIGDYRIGRQNAIGCTGSEELAYAFGKTVAVTARNLGYNVVCNPVVDMADGNMTCGTNTRSLGNDKYEVARLAKSIARGMHDSGILTVAKHYPGSKNNNGDIIDAHMAEGLSYDTKEELLDYAIYPYTEMMKAGLLDGIMTRHERYVNIDSEYPASLSKKVIDIIRECDFDGFAITDALCMMGVVAKFGKRDPVGMCIAKGNDISLPYSEDVESVFNALCEYYDRGLLPDERLDEAARRVIEAQHKTLAEPKYTELCEEDKANFHRINTDSIYARIDDGISAALSRDGKHLFVVMCEKVLADGTLDVDTFSGAWYPTNEITAKIKKLFPNSEIAPISEYPSIGDMSEILEKAPEFEDVVFVCYFKSCAGVGLEMLTPRIISLFHAFQVTNTVSTVLHFGNPYILEPLPHISRVIIGTMAPESVLASFDVLAGLYPAKGVLSYDVKLK